MYAILCFLIDVSCTHLSVPKKMLVQKIEVDHDHFLHHIPQSSLTVNHANSAWKKQNLNRKQREGRKSVFLRSLQRKLKQTS
jgi:hypothetical protein